MSNSKDGGPLEKLNIRVEKNEGENLKRTIEATRAVLASIGMATKEGVR